jgi:hypothetical protein
MRGRERSSHPALEKPVLREAGVLAPDPSPYHPADDSARHRSFGTDEGPRKSADLAAYRSAAARQNVIGSLFLVPILLILY